MQVLGIQEVSKKIGFAVSSLLSNKFREHIGIPWFKIGSIVKFDEADVNAWLESKKNGGQVKKQGGQSSISTNLEIQSLKPSIRVFEEKVASLKIKGPLHSCIGQEAVSAGVCLALDKKDYIIGNHRSHGHLIAKGSDVKHLMSQVIKGNGNSMHVNDPSVGAILTTAIVGSGPPLACGVAFASKFKKEDRVTCVFLGDGAVSEGTFHESLNIASQLRLPVLFVIENNKVAVTTVP